MSRVSAVMYQAILYKMMSYFNVRRSGYPTFSFLGVLYLKIAFHYKIMDGRRTWNEGNTWNTCWLTKKTNEDCVVPFFVHPAITFFFCHNEKKYLVCAKGALLYGNNTWYLVWYFVLRNILFVFVAAEPGKHKYLLCLNLNLDPKHSLITYNWKLSQRKCKVAT